MKTARGSWLKKAQGERVGVESVDQLREILGGVGEASQNFVLLLENGAESSKVMTMGEEKEFWVLNLIDDSEQELNANELYTQSNIGKAIDSGAFYWEP